MEYEYRDRDWEMWLEGTADNEPNKEEIIKHAKGNQYKLKFTSNSCRYDIYYVYLQ